MFPKLAVMSALIDPSLIEFIASTRLGPLVSAPKEGSWGKLVRNLDDAEVIVDDADFNESVIDGTNVLVTLPRPSLAN
jgi:hypothetical protein